MTPVGDHATQVSYKSCGVSTVKVCLGLCLLVQVLVSKSLDRQTWIEGHEDTEKIITNIQLTFKYCMYTHADNVMHNDKAVQ